MLNLDMEHLLCDEVLFDMSPKIECDEEDYDMHVTNGHPCRLSMLHDQTEEEFAQAFGVILEKEVSYLPHSGYVDLINSNAFIRKERAKAVCWLIKSQRRLSFSLGTIFNAANYLDRFISINKCQGWNTWMFELLSIACLSVAAKFNETSNPPLSGFQANGSGHYFEWRLIQRMELKLLKVIGWRLTPTTPFSYVELLMDSYFFDHFINRVTELLIDSLLDYKYLEFRPFAIAMSGIKIASEELLPKNCNTGLHIYPLGGIQVYREKEELLKCQEMMRKKQAIEDQSLLDYYCCCHYNNIYGGDGDGDVSGPSSPVTVLLTTAVDQLNTCCCGGRGNFDAPRLITKRTTQIDFYPSKRMKKGEHAA